MLAMIFQEGGKIITGLLSTRSPKLKTAPQPKSEHAPPAESQGALGGDSLEENNATSIKAGCVPCAIGHFGTCTGLLNESMRFARSDGLGSNEVIDRVSHCLQELNAMEREDLTSEKIVNLPPWEKVLALEALEASRATRHLLEGITTENDLEKATADTQIASTKISRKWFKQRLDRMPKEEKVKLTQKAIEKLEEDQNG